MTTATSASVCELLANNPEYLLENNIPRQKRIYGPAQSQTSETFGFKWHKRDTYESQAVQQASKAWSLERYHMREGDIRDLVLGKTVLDAGCGAGMTSLLFFGDSLKECRYIGVDISNAVDVAAQRFAEKNQPGEFIQASLMELPEELGQFDVIVSEGVLHHTDSTEAAVRYLAKRVKSGGLFMFYVYKKKGPVREFTDDFIRQGLADLSHQDAWNALEPLTKLGQTLGKLNVEIDIEEPIGVLDIPAGRINLQRLFYWHICKAFYRPDWTLDEMNHINFDWFRPKNCHRQTPDEVRTWVEESGMAIVKMDVQDAGITVMAKKL
jgi:SAM-dependent methyltransferase